MPPSSDTTALELYCLACLVVVVCVLIQYSITICDQSPAVSTFHSLLRRGVTSRHRDDYIMKLLGRKTNHSDEPESHAAKREDRMVRLERMGQKCFQPVYLDMCSLCFFPIAFTAFNVAYWIYYMSQK